MSNITETLKAATKDILTEDVLKEIENAFNATVTEKVNIHVKKALTEQDADYSAKLEKLVEAIDTDHTNKLNKVVEALDADRAEKLKTVIEKYEKALANEAKEFKETLVESISKYLENYLDEKIPASDIETAVKNKKALNVLNNLREALAVDMALAKDSIKEAVVDGKSRLDEAAKQLEASNTKAVALQKELDNVKAELALEKNIQDLEADKKAYMKKMLAGKSAKFITENFKYTLGLYEKTEEERLTGLKEEAVKESVAEKVDRPVIEESANVETNVVDPAFKNYMSELKKY
ncbi:MAG: hypothetical protein EBU90_20815 [Proteobacteria bacterium]|nr:hypothetical protein [Pseudomonadota bacterium]NBP15879.1 hypothetical protein [bacterium]